MDNTNNKEFWDNYVEYFENKIEEANSDADASDKTMNDITYEEYFKKLSVVKDDNFLDFGCGFGRLYPIYLKCVAETENNRIGGRYYGIDVSRLTLEHAQKRYSGLRIGENIIEYDGLHIPFADGYFDKIICWGVFDACNQEKIVRELLRVLKAGGRLLLTGKNNRYYPDDDAALVAEKNARKKGHPNYFTDVSCLSRQLLAHNARLIETYYFLKRGDFTKNKAVNEMPERFYEWTFLIEKSEEYSDFEYQKFSDKFSELFGEDERK